MCLVSSRTNKKENVIIIGNNKTSMEEQEIKPMSEMLAKYKQLYSPPEEKPVEKTKRTSKRAELIKEVYAIYCSETQRLLRRKENWKRYVEALKATRTKDDQITRALFKRNKRFIKELPIKTFCYFISVIPTDDLYYIISIAKDMNSRSQNFGGWLMANLTGKAKPYEEKTIVG